MSDLKLCPKCGGIPVKVRTPDGKFKVICWWDMSCCHHTEDYLSEQQARDAWNENNPMPFAEYHLPAKDKDEYNKHISKMVSPCTIFEVKEYRIKMRQDRYTFMRGKKGVKYGVYNSMKKEFQFGICEDSPMLAQARLHYLIGDDAKKWRFEFRPIPKEIYSSVEFVSQQRRYEK